MAPQPPRASPPRTLSVELQPIGRRAEVASGTTVLHAARELGIGLASVCGGQGICGSCRVRLLSGGLQPPTEQEQRQLGAEALLAGWRLACQATVAADSRIEIPPESLLAAQRLQLEAADSAVELDPAVAAYDVELTPPDRHDLRADASRLIDALPQPPPSISHPVLVELPTRLRAQRFSARVALHRPAAEIVAIRPRHNPVLGLAIDLGTTKLAAYLVDLETGATLAQTGAMNPQIARGEDVLRRIAYANADPRAERELHAALVDAVNHLAQRVCEDSETLPAAIVDCVAVGNTAMHHLFARLPVRQLGEAPYVPATTDALDTRASDVGLELAAGARVYLPPLIAGYVGADHVSMLLAIGIADRGGLEPATTLALDIGTNTEISLTHGGELWSCSTASGPAFEGAHITNGMRAAPGAIERVQYRDGRFLVQTVDGAPAIGLCGSGILDAVAAGLDAGIIDRRGALAAAHPLVTGEGACATCTLVPAQSAGHDRDVVFTRPDVSEIQLAKGAIRAGTQLLLQAAGIAARDLDRVVVAGAFGTYLDIHSAVAVGLLPDLPAERFQQVGNAAGAGARQLLLSRARRTAAADLAGSAHYLELTTHPAFEAAFVQAIGFR